MARDPKRTAELEFLVHDFYTAAAGHLALDPNHLDDSQPQEEDPHARTFRLLGRLTTLRTQDVATDPVFLEKAESMREGLYEALLNSDDATLEAAISCGLLRRAGRS